MKTYTYEVALSFAGEDREYVEQVAKHLRARGIKTFYDDYEKVDLWGKNLYSHLTEIYKDKARYVVMFISTHYAKKVWTNLERESAQARAFKEKREYILPARFDDTDIPGLLDTVGYISLQNLSPAELARSIENKLGDRRSYWTREADEAARYANRVLFEAHRGAFLWTAGVVAIFANVGSGDKDKEYVQMVKNELLSDKILGLGETVDQYSWVILYESSAIIELYDLVWEKFLIQNSSQPSIDLFVNIQKQSAKKALHNHFYIQAKDTGN